MPANFLPRGDTTIFLSATEVRCPIRVGAGQRIAIASTRLFQVEYAGKTSEPALSWSIDRIDSWPIAHADEAPFTVIGDGGPTKQRAEVSVLKPLPAPVE